MENAVTQGMIGPSDYRLSVALTTETIVGAAISAIGYQRKSVRQASCQCARLNKKGAAHTYGAQLYRT